MCNRLLFGIHEGGIGMAVLIRHRAAGMTLAQYDEISPPLLEEIKNAPGFVLHTAFEDSQGFCVAEIWETKEQHDSYFDEKVVPNVPAEIKQEVINLHNVFTP
jgi:quinol monooxygenase YgiN